MDTSKTLAFLVVLMAVIALVYFVRKATSKDEPEPTPEPIANELLKWVGKSLGINQVSYSSGDWLITHDLSGLPKLSCNLNTERELPDVVVINGKPLLLAQVDDRLYIKTDQGNAFVRKAILNGEPLIISGNHYDGLGEEKLRTFLMDHIRYISNGAIAKQDEQANAEMLRENAI